MVKKKPTQLVQEQHEQGTEAAFWRVVMNNVCKSRLLIKVARCPGELASSGRNESGRTNGSKQSFVQKKDNWVQKDL